MKHILRDGKMLCGLPKRDRYTKRWLSAISWTQAIQCKTLNGVCSGCQQFFYDRLNRLKKPVVVAV